MISNHNVAGSNPAEPTTFYRAALGGIRGQMKENYDMEDKPLTKPSDVVFGLFAWLTARKEVVTFSAFHDAGIAAELAREFIDANKWGNVSKEYPTTFEMPKTLKKYTKPLTFEMELRALINKHSLEGISNTPDFLLAEYLTKILEAFDYITIQRTEFFNPAAKE